MHFLKNVLKGLFYLVLLGGLGFAGLMMYGKWTAQSVLGPFFDRIGTQDLAAIQEEIHPALKDATDPRQLARLIQETSALSGPFQSVRLNGLSFSVETRNGIRQQRFEGPMVFARRELGLGLKFADGKLLGFEVKDPAVAAELLAAISRPPEDLTVYQAQGASFLERAFRGDIQGAFDAMSVELQKVIGLEGFRKQIRTFEGHGEFQRVEFVKAVAPPDKQDRVHLLYNCQFSSGREAAHVTFQFAGLRAVLTGFEVPSTLTSQISRVPVSEPPASSPAGVP